MIAARELELARQRLAPWLHQTPVFTSHSIDEDTHAQVFFKAENLQRTGAFKVRGAGNFILKAWQEKAWEGLVASSSGNHGVAVAYWARQLGVRCHLVLPESATPVKVAAAKAFGAEVEEYGPTNRERAARAQAVAEARGWLYVPSFDHHDVMAGQGTVGLEVIEQVGEFDAVVVPIGGGGLISGVASAIKHRRPHLRIIGVEPKGVAKTRRSLSVGQLVVWENPKTIADGLRPVMLGEQCFAVIQQTVDEVVTVTDEEILAAMARLLTRLKLWVEPSGACAAAYVLRPDRPLRGQRVVVVLSGGNADWVAMARLFEQSAQS